jgi:serine O-acetyltransferase
MIKHGLGTIIQAEKIGENCMIFQDVVIGFKDGTPGRPTLGNHVHVGSGAKILGPVVIGDNVDIAANTVVTKDVPPGRVAIGVPAQIILNPTLLKGTRIG